MTLIPLRLNGDYIATSTSPELAEGETHDIISPIVEGYQPSKATA